MDTSTAQHPSSALTRLMNVCLCPSPSCGLLDGHTVLVVAHTEGPVTLPAVTAQAGAWPGPSTSTCQPGAPLRLSPQAWELLMGLLGRVQNPPQPWGRAACLEWGSQSSRWFCFLSVPLSSAESPGHPPPGPVACGAMPSWKSLCCVAFLTHMGPSLPTRPAYLQNSQCP